MASPSVCAVASCFESPISSHKDFERKYGLKLALCQTHFDEFFTKFSKKGNNFLSTGQTGNPFGGNLNIFGILANALSHFTTEDKSEKLVCILSMKFNKNVGPQIKTLISSASESQEDLAPGTTSVHSSASLKSQWWQNFFKTVGISQPNNQKWIIQYASNNSKNIKESINEATDVDEDVDDDVDEDIDQNPKRSWTNWAKDKARGVKDYMDAGPTGKFGRSKNDLVAKLAIDGAVQVYDRVINSILGTVDLQEKDIPALYKIYNDYILPTLLKTKKFGKSDAKALAGGDKKLEADILKSFKGITQLASQLKLEPI
jgi:hypothetical protein